MMKYNTTWIVVSKGVTFVTCVNKRVIERVLTDRIWKQIAPQFNLGERGYFGTASRHAQIYAVWEEEKNCITPSAG